MAYQVLLDGVVVLEEDVALWHATNCIQLLWLPWHEQSLLEVRVLALRACEPWQWGRAAQIYVHGITHLSCKYFGPLRVTVSSPHTRIIADRVATDWSTRPQPGSS